MSAKYFMRWTLILAPCVVWACSLSHLMWRKNGRSDTPLFRFVANHKSGYIDTSGRIVIPPTFPNPDNWGDDDFFEGLARVRLPGGERSGFINTRGEPVPFSLEPADRHFSEGLVAISTGLGAARKYGFADRSGKIVVDPSFDKVGDFSDGLAPVQKLGAWGYIDHSGKAAVPPWLLQAERFSEGIARVIAGGKCNRPESAPCGPSPHILGFPTYKPGYDPKLPICAFSFIDKRGHLLFKRRFITAFDFSEGLAAVAEGNRMGFIDRTGEVRIPLQYDRVESFSEGLAAFTQGGRHGYMDRNGVVVIKPQFGYAEPFSSGAALVHG